MLARRILVMMYIIALRRHSGLAFALDQLAREETIAILARANSGVEFASIGPDISPRPLTIVHSNSSTPGTRLAFREALAKLRGAPELDIFEARHDELVDRLLDGPAPRERAAAGRSSRERSRVPSRIRTGTATSSGRAACIDIERAELALAHGARLAAERVALASLVAEAFALRDRFGASDVFYAVLARDRSATLLTSDAARAPRPAMSRSDTSRPAEAARGLDDVP